MPTGRFLIWGLIHGLWLGIHRGLGSIRANRFVMIAVTFHIVCLTWLFFRAESISQAMGMLAALLHGWALDEFCQFALATMAFYLIPLLAYEVWTERKGDLLALTTVGWPIRAAVYVYLTLMLLYFSAPVQNEFIYFQF